MRILQTENYNKLASFEGQVYTPDIEENFVGDVVQDVHRKKKTNFYPPRVPSSYKARHPSSVLVDRDTYRGLGDLGRERGYVEDPLDVEDTRKKITRIQKAIERGGRLDVDRQDFYNQIGADELQRISDDVEKFERDNPGKVITDSMLRMLLNRKMQNRSMPLRKRKLRQLNQRIAYAIGDDVEIELSEESEVSTILNLLFFLDNKIQEFADSKGIDPDSLKEFLGF